MDTIKPKIPNNNVMAINIIKLNGILVGLTAKLYKNWHINNEVMVEEINRSIAII